MASFFFGVSKHADEEPAALREGWQEAFSLLDTTLDEELAEFPNDFDESEWTWE